MTRVELRIDRNYWLVSCRILLASSAILSLAVIGWRISLCCCAGLACSYWWRATRVSARRGRSDERLSRGVNQLDGLPDEQLAAMALKLTGACEEFGEVAEAFQSIRVNSKCPFASGAHLWHGAEWNSRIDVAANAAANAWRLRAFCAASEHLDLDGLVLQLPSPHCDTFRSFSLAVMLTLRTLAACDKANCMQNIDSLDRLGWVFEFAGMTFFVTTFAPFYSPSDSRFAYGADCGFVLLQPEISFARRQLPPDTPNTNWNREHKGRTVRDVARSSFAEAGQGYFIRDSVAYPMIRDIVQVPKQLLPQPTDTLPAHLRWWLVAKQQIEQQNNRIAD